MLEKEVIVRIKEIEIHTKRLLSSVMVGDSRSAKKGSGFSFDQIREYVQGDDIRFIDWKSSARMNTLLVKEYTEERSRTIYLLVDASRSMFFSSKEFSKYDLAAHIASVLALIARFGKDRVGLYILSEENEVIIPPKQTLHHAHVIMQALLTQKKSTKNSVIDRMDCIYKNLKKEKAIVFLMSDFLVMPENKTLAFLSKRHDIIAIRSLDPYEKKLPTLATMEIKGHYVQDSYSANFQGVNLFKVNKALEARIKDQNCIFRKYKIDVVDVQTDKPFINELILFFKKRMMY